MRVYTIKVANGVTENFTAKGDYVRIRSITTAAAIITVEDPGTGEFIEMSQGDDVQFSGFSNLRISHDQASAQTIKIVIATGKSAGSAQVSGSITVAGQNGAFTQNRASVTNANQAIIAANANRRYCLIQNNSLTAVLRVRLDGVAATAAQGFRLQPGATLEVPAYCTTQSINAMMETADATASNVEFVTG